MGARTSWRPGREGHQIPVQRREQILEEISDTCGRNSCLSRVCQRTSLQIINRNGRDSKMTSGRQTSPAARIRPAISL
jgi:hypothetical protein